MSIPSWLRKILDRYQVPFDVHQHPPVFTASGLAQVEHVSGHRVAKTVTLSERGHPVSVVLPATERLDLARVQAVLGDEEIRLASEVEIAGWFKGCRPGAVPPLRLRSDQRILMDRSLARMGKILFAGGTLEHAVGVRFRDWYRAIRPGVGRFAVALNGKSRTKVMPTVLVVEDEPKTNQLYCRLLERQGLACRGAEGGKQALVLAREMRPSAMLLDLMLPDMSGFDVYEQFRRAGPVRRVPVIVVTALDDESSRQRCRQLGAEAYLTKPFMPETLMKTVQGALADAYR
jgi:CheY-like chemotaxis protein/prolyl-tRNA editing enzyme YbaK/EbsC (Cys-tRNA(Pro) deacylase)